MMLQRIKICGLRRVVDARCALEFGATDLGIVFAADSPRCATRGEAIAIRDAAADARVVGVFRRNPAREIIDCCQHVGIQHAQLHRAEDATIDEVTAHGIEVWRVHAVTPDARTLPPSLGDLPGNAPQVLDCGGGGSGTPFPWRLLGAEAPRRVFIAGGITPQTVAALLHHAPWGIDVSSGVERAPGIKDERRMRALFDALEIGE